MAQLEVVRRISRRDVQNAVTLLLGHRGRIYKTADGWAIGLDQNPGREILGSGPTLKDAFQAAFLESIPNTTPNAVKEAWLDAVLPNAEKVVP